FSFRTSETGKVRNQVVHIGRSQAILVRRHQALSEFLFDLAQVRFSKRLELAVRVPQLNRERIFIDASAAHFAAVFCDHADGKKLIQVTRGIGVAVWKDSAWIEHCLPQVIWAALNSDSRELGPHRSAFSVHDVTR